MFRIRFGALMMALALAAGLCGGVGAAEVDCDTAYCFSPEDFAGEEEVVGICVTRLPKSSTGTVMLGNRVLRAGDILTADQLSQLRFQPLKTEEDTDAVMTYLPIYENRVDTEATMTIFIRGKEDKAPVAEDSAVETYKNLPIQEKLKVMDPEGQTMTYTVTRQPRRGEVVLNADGTFLYTPKKNKVGVDSFTFTATDPAGNVSREATVTVQIVKPTDSQMYTDTVGEDCRFAAEWMRNTGLFVGEKVNGQNCFQPDKTVSRGEFLAMVMQLLEIPVEESSSASAMTASAPAWLRPYLTAALRSGLMDNTPAAQSGSFGAYEAVTGGEAAVMLQNVLDLQVSAAALDVTDGKSDVPTWADAALQTMQENGIALEAGETLTRGQMAMMLYQVSKLAEEAPGMKVIRMQQ